MNLIRLSFASFLLIAAAAVFTIAFGNEQPAKSDMQLCKHQYALCTSALCVPQPGDPTKAICFCPVEEGASMSSVPCNTNQPSSDANGMRHWHLFDRVLVRRNGKRLQRSDFFYG